MADEKVEVVNQPIPEHLMIKRDPEEINAYLSDVSYSGVIGETDDVRSIDCVWRNAFMCFSAAKKYAYLIASTICGLPLAFCWGCTFACTIFAHIWIVTPCFKFFYLNLDCTRKYISTCIHCIYDPIFESCALCFSKIRVQQQ
ncbi:caveolin-1-like [Tubulanus polymorphus]|uniref:caveolin-1-like n=1 Tax=Tubulanus polymorphus TaxID=672921 RepID=UPI003DA4C0A8